MADVDIAPTFGAELKVGLRLHMAADHLLMERPLGWLQASQRLGGQRHRMAR